MASVSIIIPVFNVEKYIRTCLTSIFSQNVSSDFYEVIIVNDGSRDSSIDIAKEFLTHPNLKIVSQANQGLSGARNTGLKNIKGDYIWFVDSDDWVEENVLQTILNSIYTNQPDVLVFDANFQYPDETIRTVSNLRPNIKYSGFDFLNTANLYSVWNLIYSRNLLLKRDIKFKNGLLHEDAEFNMRVFAFAQKVIYDPILAYNYRVSRKGSIMTRTSYDRVLSGLRLLKYAVEFVKENNFSSREISIIMKKRWWSLRYFYKLSKELDISQKIKFNSFLRGLRRELCFCFYYRFRIKSILLIPILYCFPVLFVKLYTDLIQLNRRINNGPKRNFNRL